MSDTSSPVAPTGAPLSLGVIATSSKENEHRLPLHPAHFPRISDHLAAAITLEHGYGARFGVPDAELGAHVAGFASRAELLERCDVVVLPKPQHEDVAAMHPGQVLWGWPHCVQDREITQLAIDRELTFIAFESMNHWASDGAYALHVFHKNNELAGYCSVVHALRLVGRTGDYGRRLSAVVIGFGATARGAVTALNAYGVRVRVLTHRSVAAVSAPIHSAEILHFDSDREPPHHSHVITERGRMPLPAFLAEADVVVNCVLQDPADPLMFLTLEDLVHFERGSLVVDVSCDEGMGFAWARPTSFEDPMFTVADTVRYYAVDHSPSYLWDSATWENSEALLPFLPVVMDGPEAWDRDETVHRAIEIRRGRVVNPAILDFQHREPDYPHRVVGEQ